MAWSLPQGTYRIEKKIEGGICPLSRSVHCNFDGNRLKVCGRAPSHQPGLIFPSWWDVRQKSAIATLCVLCGHTSKWRYLMRDPRIRKYQGQIIEITTGFEPELDSDPQGTRIQIGNNAGTTKKKNWIKRRRSCYRGLLDALGRWMYACHFFLSQL